MDHWEFQIWEVKNSKNEGCSKNSMFGFAEA